MAPTDQETRRPRIPVVAWLLVMSIAPAAVTASEELPGHEHAPLPIDTTLSLPGTVDLALAAYPDTVLVGAREQEAMAWLDRGGSWLSDRPSLMLRYQSDRWGSDTGLDEYEAGIQLPLWAWGGRSAVQDYGEALSSETYAAAAALRWQVAGLVRQSLWNVALAENDHELAEQALDTAGELTRIVERRYELGDVALSDVLLARSSYLEFQTALIDASAALLDAERAYRSVTGLERRPGFVPETLSGETAIVADHPALALANSAVERAEADVVVAEQSANTGANVLIGTRRERPAFGTELDDSVGVTLNVPFGGSSHRRVAISAATRSASAALAARNLQMRRLTLALHEAAHSLNVVHENLAAAEERLALAERQQEMGEVAYEKGELELIDLLKLQSSAIAARRQVSRLLIDEKRQTAMYNQAVGDMP
mgnify:FL=1